MACSVSLALRTRFGLMTIHAMRALWNLTRRLSTTRCDPRNGAEVLYNLSSDAGKVAIQQLAQFNAAHDSDPMSSLSSTRL